MFFNVIIIGNVEWIGVVPEPEDQMAQETRGWDGHGQEAPGRGRSDRWPFRQRRGRYVPLGWIWRQKKKNEITKKKKRKKHFLSLKTKKTPKKL